MNLSVGDKIKTKPCWTDRYATKPPQVYVVEYIDDKFARIRGLEGQVSITSIKLLDEIFTNTL
jgi:hypothetical protein